MKRVAFFAFLVFSVVCTDWGIVKDYTVVWHCSPQAAPFIFGERQYLQILDSHIR